MPHGPHRRNPATTAGCDTSGMDVQAGSPDTSLEARFAALSTEWQAVAGRSVPSEARFATLAAEAGAIIDAGRWVSGPRDLFGVLGRSRDELVHSRMLGWLLTPTARHGLGRRFLREFLGEVWPGEALAATGPVSVGLERTASGSDEDGGANDARADIVLTAPDLVLVIENKVDADEGWRQCERLYWSFADVGGEVRWLFLSPTGRAPVTAISPQARAAWRTIGYREVRRILAACLAERPDLAGDPGFEAARQYHAALRWAER